MRAHTQEDSDEEPELDPAVPHVLTSEDGSEVIVVFQGQQATIPAATEAHGYETLFVEGKGWMVHAKGSQAGKSFWVSKLLEKSAAAAAKTAGAAGAAGGAGTGSSTGAASSSDGTSDANAASASPAIATTTDDTAKVDKAAKADSNNPGGNPAAGGGSTSANAGNTAGGGSTASTTTVTGSTSSSSCAASSAPPADQPARPPEDGDMGLRPSTPPAPKKPKTEGDKKSSSSKS